MTLIQAIDERSREDFIKNVQGYNKLTPLDRVKGKLVEKIMDVYVPDNNTSQAKVVKKLKDIDLTGADDFKEEEVPVPAKKKPAAGPPVNLIDDDDNFPVPPKKQAPVQV